jgi:hypothetical protein
VKVLEGHTGEKSSPARLHGVRPEQAVPCLF